MEKIACYCQNCRAANKLGETKCQKCGTRLLLVVFPQSLKFDTNHVPSYYEDHLLERVTLLELRLAQVTEQLAMAYEFIKRETQSIQRDRASFNNLLEGLEKINPELSADSNRQPAFSSNQTSDQKKERESAESKQESTLLEILDFHGERQKELFTHLVRQALKLFKENEEKQAFQTLERAVLVSPENIPLLLYTAENFFRADKFSKAKIYLEKLFGIAAHNEKVLLLLGTLSADEGKIEEARKMLSVLVGKPKFGGMVDFIWGFLAAYENNWTESAAAFKQSLQTMQSSEIYYLIGCVNFQQQNYKNCLQNLQRAVSIDSKFADAWFMQSVVYKILNDKENADKSIESALESKEAGAQCLEFLKRPKKPDLKIALPFQHFEQEKRILTQGSLRLNNFFRRELFNSLD